ncbi:Nucleoporin [Lasiodiplodia theobromae]|uniref:Nucleoporin n=1 Tax=Lasiodiplodia theobromae TaxID=45133 RepID=A0A5N5CWD5_9PEZI|nr:Nucleoporin [Lasiodiplodia theobromae]
MATSTAPLLYRETRLNLDPPYAGSTIGVTLPPHSTSAFLSRPKGKRIIVEEGNTSSDETSFARRHLAANDASIFFRRKHPYPRTFLWRILDDRKVLELRSVDLTVDRHHKGEAILTLLLSFPNAIRPFGVALAEREDRDALNVFVLTTANELYTLDLHKDFFIRPAATEIDVDVWCKTCIPSAFSFRYPYRIVVSSALELLVSLHDGGLLRLNRTAASDGSSWRETFFSEGGWGSAFKSLIPWKGHNTVRFGTLDLEASTAAAIALSPDEKHIFTVSLNHILKAWNLETGKIGVQTDLLGENDRDPQKLAQFFIGAEQPKLMEVLEVQAPQDGDEYFVVTYSPKRHQFKFWGVRDADDVEFGIHDVQSDFVFVPPVDELMNTTVWNMEEFHFKARPGWRSSELWIRVRSGPRCMVFTLKFDLYDSAEQLADIWRNNWVAVDSGSLTVEALKASPAYPIEPNLEDPSIHSQSVSEQWIDFLFYPGRFTSATLETALCVYRRGLGDSATRTLVLSSSAKAPIKDQISAAVAAKVPTRHLPDGQIDFDQYEVDMAGQWQVFYGVIKDLHKRRGEPVALALDVEDDLPWLLLSDYATPVRACSEVEILRLNDETLASLEEPALSRPLFKALKDDLSIDVAKLLTAASSFRNSFVASFRDQLALAVKREICQEDSFSIPDRMKAFEACCGLCEQVTDEDFEKLESLLEDLGGFAGVTQELVLAALERLVEDERGHHHQRAITGYGAKSLIRGAQEILSLTHEILLDLLVLIVFMSQELEAQETPSLQPADIYPDIIERLKGITISKWLVAAVRADPKPRSRRSSVGEPNSAENPVIKSTAVVTLFESLFIGDWAELKTPSAPASELITYWCRSWSFGLPLPENWEFVGAGVLSNLLKYGNLDLATDFLPFVPNSIWGTYLKGRYYLAVGDFKLASTYLNRVSFGCAKGFFDIFNTDLYNFLSPNEKEYFHEGLSRFCQHVMYLFEKAKAHAYVMQWAEAALFAVQTEDHEQTKMLKQEVLSRLFQACVQSSNFREAYGALSRYPDNSLRRSALATLVKTMINQNQMPLLITFPFTRQLEDVDAILAGLCRETVSVSSGPAFHRLLYAFRIAKNNYRGAAQILYDLITRLKSSSAALQDPKDESITQAYLTLINTLSLVTEQDQYLLVGQREGEGGLKGVPDGKAAPRRLVTLEDLRREYQAELDRVAAMETGRFAFSAGGGDEMEVL